MDENEKQRRNYRLFVRFVFHLQCGQHLCAAFSTAPCFLWPNEKSPHCLQPNGIESKRKNEMRFLLPICLLCFLCSQKKGALRMRIKWSDRTLDYQIPWPNENKSHTHRHTDRKKRALLGHLCPFYAQRGSFAAIVQMAFKHKTFCYLIVLSLWIIYSS